MRLWILHPKYLDPKGLIALWREALLAKAVLLNQTKGYKQHPELIKFRNSIEPVAYINNYLAEIFDESQKRGYNFDVTKFVKYPTMKPLPASEKQLLFELEHLKKKVLLRNQLFFQKLQNITFPETNPIFICNKNKFD